MCIGCVCSRLKCLPVVEWQNQVMTSPQQGYSKTWGPTLHFHCFTHRECLPKPTYVNSKLGSTCRVAWLNMSNLDLNVRKVVLVSLTLAWTKFAMCVTCVQCIQTQLVRLDAQAISWWGRRYIAAHFSMRPRKIPVSVWSCQVALRSIATIYFRTIYFTSFLLPRPFPSSSSVQI